MAPENGTTGSARNSGSAQGGTGSRVLARSTALTPGDWLHSYSNDSSGFNEQDLMAHRYARIGAPYTRKSEPREMGQEPRRLVWAKRKPSVAKTGLAWAHHAGENAQAVSQQALRIMSVSVDLRA